MKITLLGDDAVRLEDAPGMMTIEAASTDQAYSPFHMLASAVASCTFSVLHSWAAHAGLDAAALKVEVRWAFAESPHRVGEIAVTLDWPRLPEARREAARRAAALCTVSKTLEHPPKITIDAR
ncbi:MAG TPA: OsmC family protein [Vicinamibacteria bacterium]|nr:OsmC family protein [Vicinamibacteria bacterium]